MKQRTKIALFIYFLFWIVYFAYFWFQAITFDKTGNLVANHINIWGDWAAHFTMGSRMAFGKLLLLKSPFIITQPFAYPFIADFISALLIKIGVGFLNAFIIPSFVFSLATVWALYFFYRKIFKSTLTAITASLLFLLNGGMGFIYFIQHIFGSDNPWLTIINPPQQYTNIEPLLYRWISVIDSMIIPQRAFALGFPLTLISLALSWSIFIQPSKNNQSIKITRLIVPVVILGLMPLIHTHSFLAAFIILTTWMVGDFWRNSFEMKVLKKWLPLALGVAIIAMPMISVFLYSQVSDHFIKWFPGWYSHDFPNENWLLFWIKNWGLIPLLAIFGFVKLLKNNQGRQKTIITFAPFFLIFIALNLFLFQPFIWDNTKLLVWTSVGFSGLSAHYLVSGWRKRRSHHLFAKIFIGVIFLVSIFSGSIDAYRAIRFKLHRYVMYSQEELELATWVKKNTNPDSIWLTGDNHNHWLFNLTGRQVLMTYRGWLWTHGYSYHDLEKDVTQMFQRPISSKNLFIKYSVNYVVIGPNEKKVWLANESEFAQFKLIKSSPNYLLYEF